MKKFVFVLVCSLLAGFAIFASPILAKVITFSADIISGTEIKASKVCIAAVCKTSW